MNKKGTSIKLHNSNSMRIRSPAFKDNEPLPKKYTCDGENINPPLFFEEVPENAKSLVLIVDDPDAVGGRTFEHWTVFNIDPTVKEIPESSIPRGGVEAMTDFSKPGYGGPCPPSGTHRYFFKLYALDDKLNLPETVKKEDIEEAMKDHVIDKSELVGLYQRS